MGLLNTQAPGVHESRRPVPFSDLPGEHNTSECSNRAFAKQPNLHTPLPPQVASGAHAPLSDVAPNNGDNTTPAPLRARARDDPLDAFPHSLCRSARRLSLTYSQPSLAMSRTSKASSSEAQPVANSAISPAVRSALFAPIPQPTAAPSMVSILQHQIQDAMTPTALRRPVVRSLPASTRTRKMKPSK